MLESGEVGKCGVGFDVEVWVGWEGLDFGRGRIDWRDRETMVSVPCEYYP